MDSNKTFYVVYPKGHTIKAAKASIADAGGTILKQYKTLNNLYVVSAPDSADFGTAANILHQYETSSEVDLTVDYNSVPWHQARLVTQFLPLRNEYDPLYTGAGSNVYVVDTGINDDIFAKLGYTCDHLYSVCGNFADVETHGTTMAQLVKSVSPESHLKIVKLTDPSVTATLDNILDCYDAILKDFTTDNNKPGIVSMSWGIPQNALIDYATSVLSDKGLIIVCSAGNTGINVNEITPAGNPFVYTVGASDKYDRVITFDSGTSEIIVNHGEELNFFAPGVDISYMNAAGDWAAGSGTSFSCAVAAGAIAQYVEANDTKEEVLDHFESNLLNDLLYRAGEKYSDTPNRLVYVPNRYYFNVWNTDTGLIGELQSATGVHSIDLLVDESVTSIHSVEYAACPDFVTISGNILEINTDKHYKDGSYKFILVATTKDGTEYTRQFVISVNADVSAPNPVEYYYDTTIDNGTYNEIEITYYTTPK